MNNYISDEKISQLIKEDVPYFDLTTYVMGIGKDRGRITYSTRQETVVACVEECIKLMGKLNIDVKKFVPSGTLLDKGEVILEAEGNASDLHKAWRVAVNILEYNLICDIYSKKLLSATWF